MPNAEDGVAGVTQDAVQRGEEYTYRFVADQAGSYWYHSHQVSHEQVQPRAARARWSSCPPQPAPAVLDVTALSHTLRRDAERSTGSRATSR